MVLDITRDLNVVARTATMLVGTIDLPGRIPDNEATFDSDLTPLNLPGDPIGIFFQARQIQPGEQNFPDVFGFQVIFATRRSLRVRIRRLDSLDGWGQELRVDILMFFA